MANIPNENRLMKVIFEESQDGASSQLSLHRTSEQISSSPSLIDDINRRSVSDLIEHIEDQ